MANRRDFVTFLVGSAAAWSLSARPQQPRLTARIGVLMAFNENDSRAKGWLSRFAKELSELGWSNMRVQVRWASNDVDRMRVFARELVGMDPDMILAFGTPVTAALQQETRTIPIVFAIVSDPVGEGFVASLSRPGGNMTGFQNSEASIGGKWLELLTQIAPRVRRVAMIFNPDTAPRHGQYYMPDFEAAARSLSVTSIAMPVHSLDELESAITGIGRMPGGGFIAMADFFLFNHRTSMIGLAARNQLPAVYPWREVPTAGGLLSYGPDLEDIVRRAALYVDRILRGAKPSELPVQVPIKFEIAVNVKTARALGLDVSPLFLARADVVID